MVKLGPSVSCSGVAKLHQDRTQLRQGRFASHLRRMGGYDGLEDLGYKKHYRVQHGQDQFAKGRNHINGIESFWPFAKARLMKFNRLPSPTFYLHLKRSEFRFNCRGQELHAVLLKMLSEKPLN